MSEFARSQVDETPSDEESIVQLAQTIDDSRSWQFLGAHYDLKKDDFFAAVISRGPLALLQNNDFGLVAECVSIDNDYECDNGCECKSFQRIHLVTYRGCRTGLEYFVQIMTETLDGRTENEIDVEKYIGFAGALLVFCDMKNLKSPSDSS